MNTGGQTARVPHSCFSLEGVPPQQRFALWRESISCIFSVEAPREIRAHDFRASIDAHVVGDTGVVRTQTQAQDWARGAGLIARDGMDHMMIQLYEAGQMEVSHRGGTECFAQGGLIVFDLAQEMASRTTDLVNLSLLLPRNVLEPHLKEVGDHHMQVLPGNNPMTRLLQQHMRSLKALAGEMTVNQATEASAATIALVAACLNAVGPSGPGAEPGIDYAFLTRARQVIEDRLAEPGLTPAQVARLAGVSRTRLYEMFEPFGGVRSYIRERRLGRALRMLLDQRCRHQPISAIALACGFLNDSAFSRAFKQRYGMAPRETRSEGSREGGGGLPVPADTGHGLVVDRRYETWIRMLTA
ncbi:helix-turn-helix domain-containing protein [Stappia indica]|uniref:helix-turn-helix domain-containing protein n=1 Tax=Stappia indica TaxID=538381 RepID=UPI001CD7DFCB|nr:helix-turn-helix domain-containing protein [Stappia indica]MCA1299358.1 helix-turn-helix domain-containing protein [Stappia indica]